MALSKKRTEEPSPSHGQSILVKDTNIWTNTGFKRGSILVEQGKIRKIGRRITADYVEKFDASGLYALPGLIDVHVHLRDMELAYKEDFATGTAAAAAGGFTTVLDMPNTLPPTTSATRLQEKQKVAEKKIYVNVGFHAAAKPDTVTISHLARAGAFSLKLYMPKPIAPFDVHDDDQIRRMVKAATSSNLPMTIHAEDLSNHKETSEKVNFEDLAKNRSPSSESSAIGRIMRIQEGTKCSMHFCHLTLKSSLRRLNTNPRTTGEVTPHHLLLSQKVLAKMRWRAWMVPPLRSERERVELLSTVRNSKTTVIASDHAPHSIREKKQSPGQSPPGIPGLETTLPLMLTLVNRGIFSISQVVRCLSVNPAKVFGLRSKAKLQVGSDADLTLVDLRKGGRIDSSNFYSKAKYSPFDGFKTRGAVHSTIVDGRLVFSQGEIVAKKGYGRILRNNNAS